MRILSSLLIIGLTLSGCGGGGGGGGDDFEAASVSVSVSPSSIDTGDRAEVRVQVSDVTPDGIILKIRFPAELSYVTGTSFLQVASDQEEDRDIDPVYYVPGDTEDASFLVFTFTLSDFGQDNSGEVVFQLRGDAPTSNDSLEGVDVDADFRGTEELTQEFATGEFSAEDHTDLRVEDEANA